MDMTDETRTPREIAKQLQNEGMRCNCDLDNWEPEESTGHSHVCRIHEHAMTMEYRPSTWAEPKEKRDGH